MGTKALKKIYYSLLANNPDYPAWEEFEWYCNDEWLRFTEDGINWSNLNQIRHNPKPKQWQPVGGIFQINPLTNCSYCAETTTQDSVDFGLMRTTKEQAEQDLKQIRQFCRFLAWRAENCNPIKKIDIQDYMGCFLGQGEYNRLVELINKGDVEL